MSPCYELARLDDIGDAVFLPLVTREIRRGEHHIGRVVAEIVELAERREVDTAFAIEARDSADRPRHDDRFEGIVRQPMIILIRLIEHRTLPFSRPIL
jgi:hypothetical protein